MLSELQVEDLERIVKWLPGSTAEDGEHFFSGGTNTSWDSEFLIVCRDDDRRSPFGSLARGGS